MTRPSDKVTILFSSFLLLLVAFNYNIIPISNYLIIIYASIILFQFVMIRVSRSNQFFAVSRDIVFPVISVLVIFDSLEGIVHNINPRDIDYILIRLDYLIFNAYPGLIIERIENPILTEILQIAYTSYYFLPITLGILLKIKGDTEGFNRTLFLILLCFYLSYVGYLLFPALGPRYTMSHLYSGELKGLLLFEHVHQILNHLEGVKRDAFPSGHTAIAITVLILAYRYHRRFFYVTLPVVLLLIFSTVYCRYHYVVDVIGGILLTVATFLIGKATGFMIKAKGGIGE
ncbi:MAG: phosphatase PAP2 family protein [Thermodesulfovibrionales bacterium]